MISVDEALALVLAQAEPRPSVQLPVTEALGLALAEDVLSDIDSPPHDKAMVDGFAMLAADSRPGAELVVVEEVTAGDVPHVEVRAGTATRIMTGVPIPAGADAVVMVERTEPLEEKDGRARIRITGGPLQAGQNIMSRGTSLERGERILQAGCVVRPIEVGLLAEVGAARVAVHPSPRVAVLATGNELVPAGAAPAVGQIRNSNGPMLDALVQRAGGQAVDLGIGRDDRDELKRLVERGLNEDVLILSGGVSAGVLDLVPEVLDSLGVEPVFHKVKLKPGKPLWFGKRSDPSGTKLVFGLPGNPVSSLVCFELFVRPALAQLGGRPPQGLVQRRAVLTREHVQRGDRPTYFPGRLVEAGEQAQVEPLEWKGSADLYTLSRADGLICFPAGDGHFHADDQVDVLLFP